MHVQIHQNQPVLTAGLPLKEARAAAILLHGRGGSAQDILSLQPYLGAVGFAFLAPQAANHTWYPNRFIAPREANEPALSSALARVDETVQQVVDAGILAERIVLLGFSQGACLAVEYAARHPQRYGGVVVFSGGLIGETLEDYSGSLAGTPVFLGCSDVDFHIPVERVRESTAVLRQMGADVTERIYPGMGHTINQDELDAAAAMMQALR